MFVCTLEDKSVALRHLDAGIFANIEKTTGVEWTQVFQAPIKNLEAGSLLLQKCAEHLGVEVPNPITVDVLVGAFTLEPSDDSETEGGSSEAADPSVTGDGA